ncbi:MAG TPA: fasciclin domain-containing protein [Actinomycetes bacterium]|nr:fasciclin domain-containing protein [Actinomycetes bacterium]
MSVRHRVAALTAAAAVAAGAGLFAPAAQAAPSKPAVRTQSAAASTTLGTRSLATVLTSGGVAFDHNWNDYDIVTAAVLAVLKAKPNSPVKVLTDGKTTLTAFIPDDEAFRILVKQLTGKTPKTEAATFAAVASLGIPTVEKILLYHVVPGVRIRAVDALHANGANLKTAEGATIHVAVYPGPVISLWDKDHKLRNPRVILSQTNINKGNRQLAHGIDRVLLPIAVAK